jgi:hypothetical protein
MAQKDSALSGGGLVIVVILLLILWLVGGLSGLIMSFVCLGYSGNPGQHLGGILLALFLGPFYWLLYAFSPGYCARIVGAGT